MNKDIGDLVIKKLWTKDEDKKMEEYKPNSNKLNKQKIYT